MRIYVASSWRNEMQPEIVAKLRAVGHEVYDFRNPTEGDHGFSWKQITDDPLPWDAARTREVLAHPIAERGFKLDRDAMKWCDAVVMVQPCGKSAALELGWCAGAGKLAVALLADGQEPELMFKVADHLCLSIEEVLEKLPSPVVKGCKFHIGDIIRCDHGSTALMRVTRIQANHAGNGWHYYHGEHFFGGYHAVYEQRAQLASSEEAKAWHAEEAKRR